MEGSTHLSEESVHKSGDNLDVLPDLLLVGGPQDGVQSSATLGKALRGDLERFALGDGVHTDLDTSTRDLLDLSNAFLFVVVVDNLGRTVRLDEVKVVRRADGDGLVAEDLGDLDGEQADRRRTTVDQVLLLVVLLCNAGRTIHPFVTVDLGRRPLVLLALDDSLQVSFYERNQYNQAHLESGTPWNTETGRFFQGQVVRDLEDQVGVCLCVFGERSTVGV